MKEFADLILKLEQTNKTNSKIIAMKQYFNIASDNDKVWAIYLLMGKRFKRAINTTKVKEWTLEYTYLPEWLFEETYSIVGDLSETISLIISNKVDRSEKSLSNWMEYIYKLKDLNELERKEALFTAWKQLTSYELFIFNKLCFGTFRIGVSSSLVVRALSQLNSLDQSEMQHNIMGEWDPFQIKYGDLILKNPLVINLSKPYPFFLSNPIEGAINDLGNYEDWQIEWKWDGIRSQIIFRENSLYVWSRGEELVTDRFPEFNSLKKVLPRGTVIDGEILPFNKQILSFNFLQTRIGRKNISNKILSEVPVVIYAYDLLEENGIDIRKLPLIERRIRLEKLISQLYSNLLNSLNLPIVLSPIIKSNDWFELTSLKQKSRENFAEGFMIKRKSSFYQVGRKKGDWWKWKIEPYSIDAVMIYAQRGHGKRANLYTDYTFAVWDQDKLVPFTKAYSGLTDKEILDVNKFILGNTKEKFGPVRSVTPTLVFEIGFEGIAESKRHKSGVALRFPRILRQRLDKKPEEANTLIELKDLLKTHND